MGRNSKELALRDTAFAAIMGNVDSDFGSDPVAIGGGDARFGGFSGFSGDYSPFGGDYSNFGADAPAGADMHAAALADPRHPMHTPNPQARAIVARHLAETSTAEKRKRLIDPNMGSDTKIQRYSFSVAYQIPAIGGLAAIPFTATKNPTVHFHPEKAQTNVTSPGFVMITRGEVANVAFTVGDVTDAVVFGPFALDNELSLPPLTPANSAIVLGYYTGLPLPIMGTYTGSFPFTMTFTGHATVAG